MRSQSSSLVPQTHGKTENWKKIHSISWKNGQKLTNNNSNNKSPRA